MSQGTIPSTGMRNFTLVDEVRWFHIGLIAAEMKCSRLELADDGDVRAIGDLIFEPDTPIARID